MVAKTRECTLRFKLWQYTTWNSNIVIEVTDQRERACIMTDWNITEVELSWKKTIILLYYIYLHVVIEEIGKVS